MTAGAMYGDGHAGGWSAGVRAVLVVGLLLMGLVALGAVTRLPQGMPRSSAVDVPLPTLSAHALRHEDAALAWEWVQGHGQFCRWECPDGRTRWACGMPGDRWAIVVVESERLITAFTTNHDYALSVIEGCYNPWRYAHP